MSRFAERRNIYAEEQVLLQELVEFLGAVEVTGLPAIERARVYAELAEGDTAPELPDAMSAARTPGRGAPSASPVKQYALFPNEEVAAWNSSV